MKPHSPEPASTVVSRFRQRLFQPWSQPRDATAPPLPVPLPRRQVGFPASIAEFLLVIRMRARQRSASSVDVLERAVRIVFVTCQNWFAAEDSRRVDPHRHDQPRTRPK